MIARLQYGVIIEACQDGYFGPNCKRKCSSSCYYRRCDKETGQCQEGYNSD